MVLMLLDTTCINEADNLTFGVAITEVAEENSTLNWNFFRQNSNHDFLFQVFWNLCQGRREISVR